MHIGHVTPNSLRQRIKRAQLKRGVSSYDVLSFGPPEHTVPIHHKHIARHTLQTKCIRKIRMLTCLNYTVSRRARESYAQVNSP